MCVTLLSIRLSILLSCYLFYVTAMSIYTSCTGPLGTLCGSPLWGCSFPSQKSWASGSAVKKIFLWNPICSHSPGRDENPAGAQNCYKFCKWKTYSFYRDRILHFWRSNLPSIQLSSTTFCGIPYHLSMYLEWQHTTLPRRSPGTVWEHQYYSQGRIPLPGHSNPLPAPLPCPFYPRKSPQRIF